MVSLQNSKRRLMYCLFQVLVLLQVNNIALCYQYKVGDLDSWAVPTPSNPNLYTYWSQKHHFQIGDSLLFLYPPSQDSVIQVTERAFNSCSAAEPILKMDDGNSVFNLTRPGRFYFTSGVPSHCQKSQKLEITVLSANGSFFPPADAPASALPASSPSYPTVFGPMPPTPPSSSPRSLTAVWVSLAVGSAIGGALFWIL